MHAIDKIVDSKLKTLSLAILKLTGLAEQAVREANVFDDDEFQVQKFWLLKIDHYKIINNFLKLKKNVFFIYWVADWLHRSSYYSEISNMSQK